MKTKTIKSQQLVVGDVILEFPAGGRRPTKTVVERLEIHACASYGTHVNGRACYDRNAAVVIEDTSKDEIKE